MDSSSARNETSRNTKQAVRRRGACGWEHRLSFPPHCSLLTCYMESALSIKTADEGGGVGGGLHLAGASTPGEGVQARTCISETAECLFWSGCQFQGPALLHELQSLTASRKGVHELTLCQGQDARSHWHSQSQEGSTLCFLGACPHCRWLLPALQKVLWQLVLSLKESASQSLLPFHLFMGYTPHSVKRQLLSHVCSLPGSSVHGILQAEILGGLPFPSPRDLPDPGIKLGSPALQEDSLPSEPPGKPIYPVGSDMILFMLFW